MRDRIIQELAPRFARHAAGVERPLGERRDAFGIERLPRGGLGAQHGAADQVGLLLTALQLELVRLALPVLQAGTRGVKPVSCVRI